MTSQNTTTAKQAFETLTQVMREDPYYAWVWHSNIMMPIYDGAKGKLTIEEAEKISKDLMRHLFEIREVKFPNEI